MVNTALTVNLCSTVTKEAQKLIKLSTIIFWFFWDTFIFIVNANELCIQFFFKI